MRFSTIQNSFRSGRLSKKLIHRIDSAQYREGLEELVGMKPLQEGGVDRVKGTRHLPLRRPSILQIKSIKTFSFVIKGVSWVMNIVAEDDNSVSVLFNRTNYGFTENSDESIDLIVQAGSTYYDANLFDACVVGDKIFITHFSGDFTPVVVIYNSGGGIWQFRAFTTSSSWRRNKNDDVGDLALPLTYHKGEFTFPMEDLESRAITVGSMDTGAFTVSLTSTNSAVVAWLQGSDVIYLEGIGSKNFGDGNNRSVTISCFYLVQGNVANGVTGKYVVAYGGNQDPMIYFSATPRLSSRNIWREFNQPKTITSHESRLVMGGCPSHPLTFFGSKTNTFNHFCQLRFLENSNELYSVPPPFGDVEVTDPYIYTSASKGDNFITNLSSIGNLCVFTDKKEHIATGNDTILSALSVSIRPQSSQGSVPVCEASDGTSVFYLSNGGRTIYRFKYNGKNGSMLSSEVGLLLSDIFDEEEATQLAWCSHINSLMILMKSGKVWGMQVSQDGEFMAVWDTNLTNVKSMAFVSGLKRENSYSRYYGDHLFIVKGIPVVGHDYFNYSYSVFEPQLLEKGFTHPTYDIHESNRYLYLEECSYQYRNNADSITYEGLVINIETGQRFVLPAEIYSDGEEIFIVDMETDEIYEHTVEGFPFTIGVGVNLYYFINDPAITALNKILICKAAKPVSMKTMPLEAGQQWGTAQHGIKNVDRIGFRVYKTYSLEMSSDGEKWENVVFADSDGKCTSSRQDRSFSANPRYDLAVYVRNTKPEPLTILGMNLRGQSNDG